VQRFTVAFNFLCVLLGILYEGRHLSLSVWRQITVNVFYSTFTDVFFYFCHVLNVFKRFFYFWKNVFSSMVFDVTITTEDSYFLSDGGPYPLTEWETSPGSGMLENIRLSGLSDAVIRL